MAYVANPPVPYVGPIGVLQPGGIIQIAGHVPPHVKWFAVNLQCGPNLNPRDDIALHINPRFEGNLSKIVRNSLHSQQWGVEENFGHFPFSPGQQFEILILTESDHFKIAINGQHFTEFRHRMPVQRVTTIAIDGDVQLFAVRYDPPAGAPPVSAPSHAPYGGAPQQPYPPAPSQYYGAPGYGPPPAGLAPGAYGAPQPPHYGAPSSPYGHGGNQLATSAPMPVPGTSPAAGRKSPSMLPGIAAGAGAGVLAGAAAYGLSKLMYPHGGMGGMHGGFGKHKGMKFKHKWHKPKFHKFPKHKGFKHKWSHKWHKGWKHGGWGSHSSSSSEESE